MQAFIIIFSLQYPQGIVHKNILLELQLLKLLNYLGKVLIDWDFKSKYKSKIQY